MQPATTTALQGDPELELKFQAQKPQNPATDVAALGFRVRPLQELRPRLLPLHKVRDLVEEPALVAAQLHKQTV